jgi:hypothetical protein
LYKPFYSDFHGIVLQHRPRIIFFYRILRFSESDYTMPSHIRYLEGLGLQGDMILAEGIRTGSAKVKARVKDAAYKVMSFFLAMW